MEDEGVKDQAISAILGHRIAERSLDQVRAILLEKDQATEEHEDGEDEALPSGLDENLLPHEWPHHRVLAGNAHGEGRVTVLEALNDLVLVSLAFSLRRGDDLLGLN